MAQARTISDEATQPAIQAQIQTQFQSGFQARFQAKILPVERRRAEDLPYDEFLTEYVIKNRPVVIENSVPQWPALNTWTPEFFKRNFGLKMVDVTYGVSRPLGEVVDEVLASTEQKPGPYLHKVIIHQHMPELLPDLSPESVYGFPRRYASPLMPRRFHRPDGYLKLLIGGVGGRFPLMHYDSDNANALITEIYGDKEFVLFGPEDTPFLYPHTPGGNTAQIDDLEHPDLEKFPLFQNATQYRGIIHPGDSAFVPSHWWHTTRVVTTSISVCVNMLHAANWPGFVSECCSPKNVSWPARSVKRLYLESVGAIMTVAEQSQRKYPRAAFSRRLASLCPSPGSGQS
jgi:Cupin-like domain